MPFTTRGFALLFAAYFRAGTRPAQFYVALVTDAVAPSHDTKTLSELTEIADGNGYPEGGYELDPNATDFDDITEDDTNQWTTLGIKTIAFAASGGDIPGSGDGARYLVLTTDEAAVGDRQIIWYESLGAERTALSGQTLSIIGIDARIQGGSVVKSVQRGVVTITSTNQSNTATISAVDTAKSKLALLGVSSSNSSDADNRILGVRLTFTNSTTITATRTSATALNGTLSVAFEVLEHF